MKTALITGASSGIGLELARLIARDKINLVLVARRADKLMKLAEELAPTGVQIYTLAKDLSKPEAAREVFAWCEDEGIAIDYLVNNAGFGEFGKFAESDWERQRQMIDLNITSLAYFTRLFLPGMINRGEGRIMNVASTAAFQPGPTMSVYYASKAFVLHFSEAIANELEGTGVTVTALCPGATESEFQAVAGIENSRLVKGRKLPTSKEVAVYGWKATQKGKKVAIHGTFNFLLASSVRFAPRTLVLKIARFIQDNSKSKAD